MPGCTIFICNTLDAPIRRRYFESYWRHRWELPGNYPVFTMVILMYHYVKRIWGILFTPNFLYNIYDNEWYHSVEPVNIYIQSLLNIMQEKNWVITTKKWYDSITIILWQWRMDNSHLWSEDNRSRQFKNVRHFISASKNYKALVPSILMIRAIKLGNILTLV